MSKEFPSGGHHWKRVVSISDDFQSTKTYVKNYLDPYGLKAYKHPPTYFCKICHISVPKEGPRLEDIYCVDVCARQIHNS